MFYYSEKVDYFWIMRFIKFRMQNLCFILEFHSRIFWLSCIWISAVVLWVFLYLSSSSAGHQRKLLAQCDYMHIDALFTNKAQMNKVLVQRLLVNMWALLLFWNLCRCCLAWAPNSIAEADEVARCQYFHVHSTSLRHGKTTWTRLGRRPRVLHGHHHDRDWVGDYVLACAWVRRGDW